MIGFIQANISKFIDKFHLLPRASESTHTNSWFIFVFHAFIICDSHGRAEKKLHFWLPKKFLFYILRWNQRRRMNKTKKQIEINSFDCLHVNICCLWIEYWIEFISCWMLLLLSSQEICIFLRTDCGGCQSMSNIIIINFLDHSVELMRASVQTEKSKKKQRERNTQALFESRYSRSTPQKDKRF